jgi:hypothetical protein
MRTGMTKLTVTFRNYANSSKNSLSRLDSQAANKILFFLKTALKQ